MKSVDKLLSIIRQKRFASWVEDVMMCGVTGLCFYLLLGLKQLFKDNSLEFHAFIRKDSWRESGGQELQPLHLAPKPNQLPLKQIHKQLSDALKPLF